MPVSDQDRDLLIRTVYGEAGNQSSVGQAAVAHVIMNRVANGQWGDSPSSVVLAKGQFEPWQTRANELYGINPRSREYQNVGKVVDSVLSGDTPDPTNGATYFLDPKIVRARRGGSLPDWAQGPTIAIGDHNFYAPENKNYGNGGSSPMPTGNLFKSAGFDIPDAKTASAETAAPTETGSLFKGAGFSLPDGTQQSSEQIPSAPKTMMVGDFPIEPWELTKDKIDPNAKPPKSSIESVLEKTEHFLDPTKFYQTGNFSQETIDAYHSGNALASSGLHDIARGNFLPSTPSWHPSTWSAGGLLKTATGAIGSVGAPITGGINSLVTAPVGAWFGPEAGEAAGLVAGLALPGPKAISVAKNTLPSNKAINALVDAIGPENVGAAVARMEANPRLSVLDVSDPVRTMAQGLIDSAQPKAQNTISNFVKGRIASAPEDIKTAYTNSLGAPQSVMQTVDALKEHVKNVGKNLINPAIENAKPVEIGPLLKSLDRQIGSPEAIAGNTPRIPLDPTQIKLLNLRNSITSGEAAPIGERVGLSIGPINDAIKSGTMSQGRVEDFTEARRLLNSARRGFTSEEDLVSGLKKLSEKQKIVGPIDDALSMIKKGPVEYRGADFLHDIQSRLREHAQTLSSSSSGSDRAMSKDLFNARETLINSIDKAAGGSYRPALSKYRDAAQIQEAYESGFETLKNRAGYIGATEDSPEALKKWIDEATDEQVAARKLGTRADIDHQMNRMRFAARQGTNIPDIEYNAQKLKTLFGEKEGSKIIQSMNDFRDQALTDSKILSGSKTAETRAGQKALEVPQVDPFKVGSVANALLPSAIAEGLAYTQGIPPGLLGSGLLASGIAVGGGKKLIQTVARQSALARNTAIAKAAAATGSERSKLMNALMSHPKVTKSINALSE